MASDPLRCPCGALPLECASEECRVVRERYGNVKPTPVANTLTFRRCVMKDSRFGECDPAHMGACASCPQEFPSLSLMQRKPPFGGPRAPVMPTDLLREPVATWPTDAPKPVIRMLGDGLYRCRCIVGNETADGYGNTAVRAWNACAGRMHYVMEKRRKGAMGIAT